MNGVVQELLNISYDRACVLRSIARESVGRCATGKNYHLKSSRIQYLERHGLIKCIDRDTPIGAFIATEKGLKWVAENAHLKGPKAFKNNYA